jgi:hypothetical protein|tara:strand:+ start:49 stop:519 length:471 start_codon:yes stop_codon:yes gene_type:complete
MRQFLSLLLLFVINSVSAQKTDSLINSTISNQTILVGKHKEIFYLENEYGNIFPCIEIVDSTYYIKLAGEISKDSIHFLIQEVTNGFIKLRLGKPTFKVSFLQNSNYSTFPSDSIHFFLSSSISSLKPTDKIVVHDIQFIYKNQLFTLEEKYWIVK